jgi:hypothetical protein
VVLWHRQVRTDLQIECRNIADLAGRAAEDSGFATLPGRLSPGESRRLSSGVLDAISDIVDAITGMKR